MTLPLHSQYTLRLLINALFSSNLGGSRKYCINTYYVLMTTTLLWLIVVRGRSRTVRVSTLVSRKKKKSPGQAPLLQSLPKSNTLPLVISPNPGMERLGKPTPIALPVSFNPSAPPLMPPTIVFTAVLTGRTTPESKMCAVGWGRGAG